MSNTVLKNHQQEIINELVNDTLKRAAFSMSKMLKIRVQAEHVNHGSGYLPYIQELSSLGRFKVHLVRVQFSGEISGAFFFIMNSHEVDLINQVCLPSEMNKTRRSENKMMQHGFMSEIENVISAQAIDQISEYFGAHIGGGVPEIEIVQGTEVNRFLKLENMRLDTAYYVTSVLKGVAVNISPFFFWILGDDFIEVLKLNT